MLDTAQQHNGTLRLHAQPRLLQRLERRRECERTWSAWSECSASAPEQRGVSKRPQSSFRSPRLESKGSGQASQNHHPAGRKGWCQTPTSGLGFAGAGSRLSAQPPEQDAAKDPASRLVPI